jgi:hypothetical protein
VLVIEGEVGLSELVENKFGEKKFGIYHDFHEKLSNRCNGGKSNVAVGSVNSRSGHRIVVHAVQCSAVQVSAPYCGR